MEAQSQVNVSMPGAGGDNDAAERRSADGTYVSLLPSSYTLRAQ